MEVIEVFGVGARVASRQVADSRRRVWTAIAGVNVEVEGGVTHGSRRGARAACSVSPRRASATFTSAKSHSHLAIERDGFSGTTA